MTFKLFYKSGEEKNEKGEKPKRKMVQLDRVKENIVWLRFPETK